MPRDYTDFNRMMQSLRWIMGQDWLSQRRSQRSEGYLQQQLAGSKELGVERAGQQEKLAKLKHNQAMILQTERLMGDIAKFSSVDFFRANFQKAQAAGDDQGMAKWGPLWAEIAIKYKPIFDKIYDPDPDVIPTGDEWVELRKIATEDEIKTLFSNMTSMKKQSRDLPLEERRVAVSEEGLPLEERRVKVSEDAEARLGKGDVEPSKRDEALLKNYKQRETTLSKMLEDALDPDKIEKIEAQITKNRDKINKLLDRGEMRLDPEEKVRLVKEGIMAKRPDIPEEEAERLAREQVYGTSTAIRK